MDAWARYLSPSQTSETRETAETFPDFKRSGVSDETQNVSDSPADGSLNGGTKNPTKSTSVSDVSDVSILADGAGREPDVAASAVSDVSDDGWRNDQADDIPTDQTCAQCNGTIDGTERMVSVSGHTVWLHETCERFWRAVVAGER